MKRFSLLLIVFGFVFSSCGSSTSTQVLDEDISGTTVTVGVWKGNDGEERALDNMIKGFEEKTGAKVDKRTYTDINQQLPTELIGGEAPDVFYIDSLLVKSLINDGALLELDDYIEELDDFYPNILKPFQDDDGKTYALPKDFSTLGVFYNKDLLAQAGYTEEDIPTKLEDYPKFIEELQSKLPDGKTAFLNTVDISRCFTWLQTKGVSILTEDGKVNFEDETIVKNAQILLDLAKADGSKEAIDIGYDWGGDAFGAGDAAIIMEGPWLLPTLNGDYPDTNFGVIEMPTYNGEKNTPAYTVGWGVNANAENLSGGVQFANYAGGEEGMSIWCEQAKVLPSRKSVSNSLNVANDEIQKIFLNQADYATVWQMNDITSKVIQEFNNIIPKIIDGEYTIKEGFKKIDDAINKDLEDFNA